MKMNHFIVEGYCEENEECASCKGTYSMGVHCFNCRSFSCTLVENEILFVSEHGESEEIVGFGGEMEPSDYSKREKCVEMWKNICKNKINEAYDEYMRMLEHGDI